MDAPWVLPTRHTETRDERFRRRLLASYTIKEEARAYDRHIQRCILFAVKQQDAVLDGSVVGTRRLPQECQQLGGGGALNFFVFF